MQFECPKCNSQDTRFVELREEMSVYGCNICGYRFEIEEESRQSPSRGTAFQLEAIEYLYAIFSQPDSNLMDIAPSRYALVKYYPLNIGLHDRLSQWILRVKENDRSYATAFGVYMGFLIQGLIECDCVTRALGHNELVAESTTTGLDIVGQIISIFTGSVYDNKFLQKHRTHQALHQLNSDERRETLRDNYFCADIEYHSILVIDDVLTRGTTFKSVCKAIKGRYPLVQVSCLAIGKTVGPCKEKQVDFDYDAFEEYLTNAADILKKIGI